MQYKEKFYLGKMGDDYVLLFTQKNGQETTKRPNRMPNIERLIGYLQATREIIPEGTSRTIVNGIPEKKARTFYPNNRITPLSELDLERLTKADIRDIKSVE